MKTYPIFLILQDKPCLVVGGGAVAGQKARALAAAGARVTVVAPRVSPAVRKIRGIKIVPRVFRPQDLFARGSAPAVVVAATDDRETNHRIAALCRRRRVWVNVVDDPAHCDFIAPAVARRGPLTLAASTGGASPALAKLVRRRLEEAIGPEYGKAAALLRRWRPRLLKIPMARRRRLLEKILTPSALSSIRSRGTSRIEKELKKVMTSVQP